MFRFAGSHFYRSYSLSIAKRFLALCRFWSGDVCPADSEFLYINQWNTKAEMFPAAGSRIRRWSVDAVANAIYGGSAEYVALSLKSIGMETAFFWYVTLMAVVAFPVFFHATSQRERGCVFSDGVSCQYGYSRCLHRRHPRPNPSSSSRSLRW